MKILCHKSYRKTTKDFGHEGVETLSSEDEKGVLLKTRNAKKKEISKSVVATREMEKDENNSETLFFCPRI